MFMRGKLFEVILLTTLAAVSPHAGAHGPHASKSDIPQLAFDRYKLDNGLEVILHEDRRVPLVAVDIWYHVGSGNEVPGKSGFAHLFEHMMFQGAKHIGMDVHFDILREVGASGINGTTNTDRTNYFEVVPSNHIETALWLESDRMGYMLDLLDERSLANQRDVVRNERRQGYDNVPYGKERFAIAEALYPEGHPYRYLTIGRHEELEGASLADVRSFFAKWYVPSNATLVLAGDFDVPMAKKLIEKWFSSFPKTERPTPVVVPMPRLRANVRKEIEDPFARLTRVHYAWHSPAELNEGDAELSLLARILAAEGWGRLNRKLVIERQLVRTVAVFQSGSDFSGAFHVIADLKPGVDSQEVERILVQELDRVLAQPVSDAELRRAVNGFEASFVRSLEDLSERSDQLQFFNHYANDPGHLGRYIEHHRSRTPSDLQRVANTFLSKPRVEVISRPGGGKP